jgi:hypothetical protein
LQLPNGQENSVGVDVGQPPAGQGQTPPGQTTAASDPESGPPSVPPSGDAGATHMLFTHVAPPMQGAPHPPQLALSLLVLTHVPLQVVGALDGQVVTQPNEPPLPSAQTPASPSQMTSQAPQLVCDEGSWQPASQVSKPLGQPPSPSAAEPSSLSGASVPGPPPASAVASSAGCTLASQSSVQAEYPLSPEMAAHEPSTVARATVPSAPDSNRIILRFFQ